MAALSFLKPVFAEGVTPSDGLNPPLFNGFRELRLIRR